jgi:hypothetical protein
MLAQPMRIAAGFPYFSSVSLTVRRATRDATRDATNG